jgi:hypothetical protein
MARLEDIPKKQSLKVPDGYFEALPMRIQARIEGQKSAERPAFSFGKLALRYALPVLAVGVAELVAFLEDEGITTEDLLEQATLSDVNLDNMQKPLDNISAEDLDAIANEFDINI